MNMKRGFIVESFAVCCSKCGAHEALLGALTKRAAGKMARAAGWLYSRWCGWRCEDCGK